MDFRFSQEQEAFRQEIRQFLKRELPLEAPEVLAKGISGRSPAFSRKVARKGWIGLAWPREYGGKGIGHISRTIYSEEMVYHGAPSSAHWALDHQTAPSLIAHGSKEQKQEFLPKILRAEITMCNGFSEPDAGSDLASLKTRAVEDGEDFVINGQKVWTSNAHLSDYCWLAARTDPSASKHKGISEFIIDLRLPGISIRQIKDMCGNDSLCEVFFQNVRVPRSALVGEKNQGWQQITSQFSYERSGIVWLMRQRRLFDELVAFVRERKAIGPDQRWSHFGHKLAELEAEFQVGYLLCYRTSSMLDQGRLPGYEASFAKLYGTEHGRRVADLAMEILGLHGGLRYAGTLRDPELISLAQKASRAYMTSLAATLEGGTSEVQRNVIAQRGLGLPRT